ncbi:MAG TPA: hypothetical protein VNO52_11885, partial [Methylomirabilota bacterium]|nr:hypothetical protein [Methylomirabilota bacterium]
DEVVHARRYDALLGPGHPHDVLGLPVGGVHQHDLSLGAGSFDGVFGVTVNSRWSRWFVRGEAQYYLRTEGTAGFEYGDELILSGGPGVYLYSDRSLTFSVQGNVVFDREARAALDGRESNHTGMTACYVGPQIFLTWGRHLTANAGIDVPVAIDHRGYQNVPDWRLHFGFTWWF